MEYNNIQSVVGRPPVIFDFIDKNVIRTVDGLASIVSNAILYLLLD